MKAVYQAFDGEIFDNEDKCFAHEFPKHTTDVELYHYDRNTGELYKLELTYENIDKASIIVIKTEDAVARLQEQPYYFPEKVGIYTRHVYGWDEWEGSFDELQNNHRTIVPWQRYLDDLTKWAGDNYCRPSPHSPMSYDEWLSKEHNKEDNSNDR